MSDHITSCPLGRGPCPLAVVRQARTVEQTVVHCERCHAELLVGPGGALPACPCGKEAPCSKP